MNKRALKGYFLIFLVLVLYITVTLPFPKNVVFWIAWGFSVPVFIAQIFVLHAIYRQDIPIKDRALDFPRLRISLLYLVIQSAASLLLMKFAPFISVFAAIAIEVAILLIAVIGFYAVESACAEIIRQNTQVQDNMAKMQDFKERLNLLLLHCDQEQIQKRLRKLADDMQYCNPTSTDSVLELENEIASLLTEIEDVSLDGDADTAFVLCDRMSGLLKERDRLCKCRR